MLADPLAIAASRLRARAAVNSSIATREFASPEHEEFYHSTAPEIVFSGWMGVGKSRILCEKAWDLALQHPGVELGIFRKYAASLASTTMRTFSEEVADERFILRHHKSEHWYEVSAGSKPSRIWYLGLDPDPATGSPSKVGSLNLDAAFVDEAIELTSADYIMINGRLRRKILGFNQVASATNPSHPRHWLKERFSPPTERRVWIAGKRNRFLTEEYLARLADMGDGVQAQRLVGGLWVAAEGTIWLLPEGQILHVGGPFKRTIAGLDWGFVHPFAVEVIGETGLGRRAVIAEIYRRGWTMRQLLPELKELQERLKIDSFYADPSEPAYIKEARDYGLRIEEAENSVLPGINAVAAAISAGLTVDPACEGLLTEIPDYTWQRDRATQDRKEAPVKLHDDACDALRYAIMALDHKSGFSEYYRQEAERLVKRKEAA